MLTIRSGILEMKEKVIRFFHEMRNDETDEIAAVTVITGIHLDNQIRKSVPFPSDILERGQQMIIEHDPGI